MTHEKINTASQLIPQPERSAGGGVTTMVSYPIEFPDIDRATMLDRELNFDEKTQVSYLWMDETSEKVKNLNKNFMQSVKRKTINFDNKSELREAIRDAGANIQQIEQMRMRLALFIKENIPMNEIIV